MDKKEFVEKAEQTLNRAFEAAKKSAKAVAEKAGEAAHVTKLLVEKVSLEHRVTKQFARLGGCVYEKAARQGREDLLKDPEVQGLVDGVKKLETELQRAQDTMRTEIFQEMRAQYEPKMAEANRDRQRLEQEIQAMTAELATERTRLSARVEQLEKAIPEAQEAARKQALAELQGQFDVKIEEATRLRSRLERKQQDAAEQWEAEVRRAKKQITALEEQLKEAKEAAYKAQKARG